MSEMPALSESLLAHVEQVTDSDLLAFMERRIERTAEEFGIDPARSPRPVHLLCRPGEDPETIRLQGGGCLIFLAHVDDWHRARYQLAHEVTHNVLSPYVESVFDWVQEMFAVHMSVRAMRELGAYRYASTNDASLWERSTELSLEAMREADLSVEYPPGLYGRAYVTGLELIDQIGWERLKFLGAILDETGRHDISKWLGSLDAKDRDAAKRVLEQ